MSNNLTWIFLLILQCVLATSRPLELRQDVTDENHGQSYHYDNAPNIPKYEDTTNPLDDEKVISVRITSSVAVGRGKGKIANNEPNSDHGTTRRNHDESTSPAATTVTYTISTLDEEDTESSMTELPPNLIGANIEFIKQLNAKKEMREHQSDQLHPYQMNIKNEHKEESSTNSELEYITVNTEDIKDIPLARNIPHSYYTNQLNDRKDTYNFPSSKTNKNNETENTVKSMSEYILEGSNNDMENLSLQLNYETTEAIFLEDHTLDARSGNHDYNETDDSIAESSIKSVQKISDEDREGSENIDNVPLARSVSPSSQNYVHGLITHNKPLRARVNDARLTTVSFNIVHDTPNMQTNYNEPTNTYIPSQALTDQQKIYQPKIFSEPAKIYSEPAKFYSEPAKIYSEPAKIYSEPAKIYSEPAKIYSEPAKFYSEPASLHLSANAAPQTQWQHQSQNLLSTTTITTTPLSSMTNPAQFAGHRIPEHQVEKNYEVDENQSVRSNGRTHGIQESSTEKCKQDNCKVGYVVEGRQYKKYRVEERTSDGFIVGEYGVVRNEDGALRGVRYTADSEASPRLIYDALMKFLQLK